MRDLTCYTFGQWYAKHGQKELSPELNLKVAKLQWSQGEPLTIPFDLWTRIRERQLADYLHSIDAEPEEEPKLPEIRYLEYAPGDMRPIIPLLDPEAFL